MKIVSIIAAILFFVVALYATGIHLGFEIGYAEGEKLGSSMGFISGGTAYGDVGSHFGLLVLCSIGCIVSFAIRNILISSIICFSFLIAAIRPVYHIYLQKSTYMVELESFNRLLKESPFLEICVGMCITLLVSQIIMICLHFRKNHKISPDTQT